MSTLLNPHATATYDPTAALVILAFRDGRDASVIELDPEAVPGLINSLMAARCEAKKARTAVPLPPPMVRPPTCPTPAPAPAVAPSPSDHKPIRLTACGRLGGTGARQQ